MTTTKRPAKSRQTSAADESYDTAQQSAEAMSMMKALLALAQAGQTTPPLPESARTILKQYAAIRAALEAPFPSKPQAQPTKSAS